jgi:hypothetical protein
MEKLLKICLRIWCWGKNFEKHLNHPNQLLPFALCLIETSKLNSCPMVKYMVEKMEEKFTK